MPKNRKSGMPGPLDSLPRPLSERHRGAGRGRRLLTLLTVAVVAAAAIFGASSIAGRSGPTGQVAGVSATPEPTRRPVAVDSTLPAIGNVSAPGAPSSDPSAATATPKPTPEPTPVPTPAVVHGPDPASLDGYRWPLAHGRLTLPFGPTPWGDWIVDGKNFHDGIDIATFCNDRIVAAHAGVVLAASRHFDKQIGWVGSLGPRFARLDKGHLWNSLPIVIITDDGNGYRSIYAHFWKVVVKPGDTVDAGQLLGYEGMTGHASGCHLHYGLFSPQESAKFAIDKDVGKRMKLPTAEIARIDPLLVLPHRKKDPKPMPAPGN